MGLFSRKKAETPEQPVQQQAARPTSVTPTPVVPQTAGVLNLSKNQVLDLTKTGANMQKLKLAAGWDMARRGADYDLDLFAVLLGSDGRLVSSHELVYFGNKKENGIRLDGDNLTGEGDGDDENIFINLEKLNSDVNEIVLCVAIYSADSRRQSFEGVKNAYVRLVDTSAREREVCRYNLSSDGGNNTAVVCAKMKKINGAWNFEAVGDYSRDSIKSLKAKYK